VHAKVEGCARWETLFLGALKWWKGIISQIVPTFWEKQHTFGHANHPEIMHRCVHAKVESCACRFWVFWGFWVFGVLGMAD
jgi:hypothetical protein